MSDILSILFIACSIVCFLNVKKLLADKTVKGVSLVPSCIFITTNAFEIIYFGMRHDWMPVAGAVMMTVSNVVWLALAIYYLFDEAAESIASNFSLDL